MGWLGLLDIDYTRDGDRTVALDRHDGPLRVLQRLYPEGDAICHHVLVHPPGGLVGGDELRLNLRLGAGTHALITTPGATRFYRSSSALACQQVIAEVAAQARLEWLPQETIAYDRCQAINRLRFDLAPGAEMIGAEVLALGLPAAGLPWAQGRYSQHLEIPGAALEQAHLDAGDLTLLDGPTGWAGRRVMGTMWFASGTPLPDHRREILLDAARQTDAGAADDGTVAGVTSPDHRWVVMRALGPNTEAVTQRLRRVWASWRRAAWDLSATAPRIWRM